MTTPVSFYFVDVFASRPLSGNPLSLVADADRLDESQMRAISREFNQPGSSAGAGQYPRHPGSSLRHEGHSGDDTRVEGQMIGSHQFDP